MEKSGIIKYYYSQTIQKDTLIRATRVALLVGAILNFINTPEMFLSLSFEHVKLVKVVLTFAVPFCVSTYSSVLSNCKVHVGDVSHLDAILKCKSCKKSNFHIHIGVPIEECPHCKHNTRWKLQKVFSMLHTNKDTLKNLALFARYNPQPLFRTNHQWLILGANPASEELLGGQLLQDTDLTHHIPEVSDINIVQLIEEGRVAEKIVQVGSQHFNLVLRGIPALNSVQVYANNITEIVLAERKIKLQAKDIQESINYAWRKQQAMLPNRESVKRIFNKHFIFYQPKHTVSGDFFWVNQVDNYKILAVGDCTGHGVPGAFMSIMGISLLNEVILREGILAPERILNTVRERLISLLNTQNEETNVADGMDIALVVLDPMEQTLSFAGAYNPLYILNKGNLNILKADKMPVGKHVNDPVPFSAKTYSTQPGDRLMLFTDGFKDQFGGEDNKKLNTKGFQQLLINTSLLSVKEQYLSILSFYKQWKGSNEQVDDVLILGVEV